MGAAGAQKRRLRVKTKTKETWDTTTWRRLGYQDQVNIFCNILHFPPLYYLLPANILSLIFAQISAGRVLWQATLNLTLICYTKVMFRCRSLQKNKKVTVNDYIKILGPLVSRAHEVLILNVDEPFCISD